MEKRSLAELEKLLGHADQRMPQEAQFELVDRARIRQKRRKQPATDALLRVARDNTNTNTLLRLHAIWGLGQVGRVSQGRAERDSRRLLSDTDAEVRAQTAKVMGDDRIADAFAGLTNQLADPEFARPLFSPRKVSASLAIPTAVKPLLAMLRANLDQDVFLRHAGVMGLLGAADKAALLDAAKSDWRSVRMAALLVMRRKQMPEISMFLHDADQLVVLEAARAINDLPINEALPQLAALIEHPTGNRHAGLAHRQRQFSRRWRIQCRGAGALCGKNKRRREMPRTEAVRALATWAKPSRAIASPVCGGHWRRGMAQVAAKALQPVIGQLITERRPRCDSTAMPFRACIN